MKTKVILSATALLISTLIMAQTEDQTAIEKTINAFALAGDQNNADELSKQLDPNYRIAMNQLFGSTEVSIMPREVYLEKIRSKQFGGDTRIVSISNLLVNGKTASALVTMKGAKMTMISIFVLVKDKNEKWKIISDIPSISSK